LNLELFGGAKKNKNGVYAFAEFDALNAGV